MAPVMEHQHQFEVGYCIYCGCREEITPVGGQQKDETKEQFRDKVYNNPNWHNPPAPLDKEQKDE